MKRNVLVAVLVMMGMHAPPTHAVKLYKWVDEQGNVTYQDRPPPATASEVEEKDIDPNAGVTKFALPKPTEPPSDYGRLRESEPNPAYVRRGGLTAAEEGAIVTTDRPFIRNERRRPFIINERPRGIVPTPPPRPAPAVPPRAGRRVGIPRGGGIRIPRR